MSSQTTIMMITFNRLELTKKMLDSFFLTTKNNYSFIIIDNGSIDGTQSYLEEIVKIHKEVPIHLQFNVENKGIAIGRNQGLLLAKELYPNNQYLATIDNDVELPNDWLNQCISLIQDNHKLAIGVNFEKNNFPLTTRNNKIFQLKPEGNLGTACAVFHKELVNRIGYFNTEYGNYASEDSDYFFRARRAGWEMGYLAENGVHLGEGEFDQGEYREYKTQCHKNTLKKFQMNCYAYMNGVKPIYLPYVGPSSKMMGIQQDTNKI